MATNSKEVKLENLGNFYKGTGIPRDGSDSGELPAVRYGELYTDYDTFISGETRSKISEEIAEGAFKLEYGDILLAGSGETPEDIGKSAVFLLNEGYAGGDIIVFRPDKTKVNSKFLALYFETEPWKKQRRRVAQGQSIVHIHTADLKKMIIELPNLETQQKIVQILDSWNKQINQINQLLFPEITINKILSQNVAKKAFAKESVKKSIKNYLKERKQYQRKASGLPHVSLTKEGVVPKSERYNRDFLVKNDDEKQYKVTKKGDICYNPANLKFGVICRNHLGDGIFSPIYVTFEIQNANPDYLEALLTSSEFIGRSLRYEQGTVYERKAVSPEDLLRMEVFLPSIEEQERIADIIINQKEYINKLEKFKTLLVQQYRYLLNHLISSDFSLTNIKLKNGKE